MCYWARGWHTLHLGVGGDDDDGDVVADTLDAFPIDPAEIMITRTGMECLTVGRL